MPQECAAYKKWLLCYLNFCKKYNHPCVEPNSLSFFCDKLKEKRQNDAQRIQAQLAVKRYYSEVSQETSAPYWLHKVKQIRMETKGSTTGEGKLGPPWDIAIKALKNKILVRHYSKTTLRAYSLWAKRIERYPFRNPSVMRYKTK